MARTLVSVLLAWNWHTHDSLSACVSLTLTVNYTDTVVPAKEGTVNHSFMESRSQQTTSTTPAVDQPYQDALLARIQNYIVTRLPTTLADVQSKTTITKVVAFI